MSDVGAGPDLTERGQLYLARTLSGPAWAVPLTAVAALRVASSLVGPEPTSRQAELLRRADAFLDQVTPLDGDQNEMPYPAAGALACAVAACADAHGLIRDEDLWVRIERYLNYAQRVPEWGWAALATTAQGVAEQLAGRQPSQRQLELLAQGRGTLDIIDRFPQQSQITLACAAAVLAEALGLTAGADEKRLLADSVGYLGAEWAQRDPDWGLVSLATTALACAHHLLGERGGSASAQARLADGERFRELARRYPDRAWEVLGCAGTAAADALGLSERPEHGPLHSLSASRLDPDAATPSGRLALAVTCTAAADSLLQLRGGSSDSPSFGRPAPSARTAAAEPRPGSAR